MNQLSVPFIEFSANDDTAKLHAVLAKLPQHELPFLLWSEESDKPSVRFSIAHNSRNIFLSFVVAEKFFRVQELVDNGPVWQDTCVEFFISFDQKNYYNIETNAIGTKLAGFGPDGSKRTLLPKAIVEKIATHVSLTRSTEFKWNLVLIIPVEVFCYHPISTLATLTCNANFYKCGDKLPKAHFLAWNKIQSPHPNFHLPEFFGSIHFDKAPRDA